MNPSPKPSPRQRKRRKLSLIADNLENECVELWKDCIYLKAGFKSELSGISGILEDGKIKQIVAHHRIKKGNHWLKFSLTNGICITHEEHSRIHQTTDPIQFLSEAEKMCSPADWMELMDLKRSNTKRPLITIKEDLLFTRNVLLEKEKNNPLTAIYKTQRGIE